MGLMRNHYVLMASRCFDLHKDYEGFTVGKKEFEIQKVNVLQKNQYDFILVDDGQTGAVKSTNEEEDLFQTTSN